MAQMFLKASFLALIALITEKTGGHLLNAASHANPNIKRAIGNKSKEESTLATLKAQAPKLDISGFTSIYTAITNQKITTNGLRGNDSYIGIGDSRLTFDINGRSDKGLKYKYVLEMKVVPDSFELKKNYVEFENTYGIIQLGNVKGPDDTLYTGPISIIGPGAGLDGGVLDFFNMSAGTIKGVDMIGRSDLSSKITYYTPRLLGFQFGVSFTPHTSHLGGNPRNATAIGSGEKGNYSAIYPDRKSSPYGTGNVTLGVNFIKGWQDFVFKFGAVTILEKSNVNGLKSPYGEGSVKLNPTKSYQLFGSIRYNDFTFGAGYLNNLKSRLPKNNVITTFNTTDAAQNPITAYYISDYSKSNSGRSFDVAASYQWNRFKFALGYHEAVIKIQKSIEYGTIDVTLLPGNPEIVDLESPITSTTNKLKTKVVTLRGDYDALAGLKFFAEVDFVRTKTSAVALQKQKFDIVALKATDRTAVPNNRGTMYMIGTSVNF
jgi:hypothetical protein